MINMYNTNENTYKNIRGIITKIYQELERNIDLEFFESNSWCNTHTHELKE